ncbi:hypothetical protein C1H76_3180 [Elsinoe australis]|uniref:Heterokaryon incompatibility domain-containing protein n=1 Tax=Elsinoe australis TaxID=40998 RepID=A0A4U7B519_9PEZI|nr:hypothetical protein C1H76_3180 [Elsinoe australis]
MDNADISLNYRLLIPDKGFRILILAPSHDFNADIQCDLLHVDLDEDYPPFQALSYVWGQSTDTRPVRVGGKTFNATLNLESALRHLRLPGTARHLWVDAICIDQQNNAEKSNHISYMSKVYTHCKSDILWLGTEDRIIHNATAAMAHFGNLWGLNDQLRKRFISEEDRARIKQYEESIKDLFAAPAVWKRAWIVQEVAFAPKIMLVAGHSTLQWEEVESFLVADEYIKKYGVPDAFHGPFSHDFSIRSWAGGKIAQPQIMLHQRKITHGLVEKYKSTLLDVLARFRHTQCTDPRDKIYALLGLVEDDLDIVADYSLELKDIYMDCMKRLMEHDQNLDLLCQAPWKIHRNKDRETNLPSWVIDFGDPGEEHILFAQRSIFNAGGDDIKMPLNISSAGVLTLQGFSPGTLAWIPKEARDKIYPPYPPYANVAFEWMPNTILESAIQSGNESLRRFLKPVSEPCSPAATPESPTTPSAFERFWRTLMIDVVRYPMRRTNETDLAELSPQWNDWLSKPLDDKRDIDIDFFAQGKMYEPWVWGFAVSDRGDYCRISKESREGDCIAVLRGAKVPLVLRPEGGGRDARYSFVGPCYVHGFMDGEVRGAGSGFEEREFEIA